MIFIIYVLIGCATVLCLLICDSDFREAVSCTNLVATIGSILGTSICVIIWPLIVVYRIVDFLRAMLDKMK